MTRRVLVTGASGFVGEAVVAAFNARGFTVRAATRDGRAVERAAETVAIGDLATLATRADVARAAVEGCQAVIHAAGLAHQDAALGEDVYHAINTDATLALGRATRDIGARFIFVSSIRAQVGPFSPTPIDETTPTQPVDAYGRSKLAAERGLQAIEGLDAISVRPVLVHAPGAKGNLASLAKAARLPVPWPTGLLRAPRSVVARADLADALALLVETPHPAHRLYIAADPVPLSLNDMLAALARAQGRRALQVPLPSRLIGILLRAVGRGALYERIARPLVANPARLLAEGWRPTHPFGADINS